MELRSSASDFEPYEPKDESDELSTGVMGTGSENFFVAPSNERDNSSEH